MRKKTHKKGQKDQYLLKRDNEFFIIQRAALESLPVSEIFKLGVTASHEQRAQLLKDAQKEDSYVFNIKIVDGLEESLRKMEEMFPSIKTHIRMMDEAMLVKIGKC